METALQARPMNKQAAKHQRDMNSDADDLISPAWRRFWSDHCWPAWRLERCKLDELLRLRNAIPYLTTAIDRALATKRGG